MKTKEITNEICKHLLNSDIKLEQWGYGEWVEEPELVEFSYLDIKCKIVRQFVWERHNNDYLSLGALCGYIMIPIGHSWHGKDYDDIECEAHGGLTFSEMIDGEWWIGFDCMHGNDVTPGTEAFMKKHCSDLSFKFPKISNRKLFERTYKNINYVKREIMSLVDQMLEKNGEI